MSGQSTKEKIEQWRIPRILCYQPGSIAYIRAYGWGWLALLGVMAVVAGGVGLALEEVQNLGLWLVFGGFTITFTGVLLSGFSERRHMLRVEAFCLDVQIKYIGGSIHRSAGWGVRALVYYQAGGKEYRATPEPLGYFPFFRLGTAKRFARQLREAPTITIYIDPKRPKRTLFFRPKPSN